jgi:hypothetical protein
MTAIRAKTVAQLSPSPIRWLWEPYLVRGSLVLLDGDPEIGKSLITIDLAARLSRGGELPNGLVASRPHVTILLGTEDNPADTIGPRVIAAGTNPERVIVPDEEDVAGLSFPANVPELEELIRAHAADLAVIDPIASFLPSTIASTTDHGVRKSLKPLAALARRTDCTILLVRHLRKLERGRALYRGLGSIGFIAAARTGLFAARHPTDPTQSVLAVMKSNAAVRGLTLGYRIKSDAEGRAVVEWTGPVQLSADAANKPAEASLRMRDRAAAWLTVQLASGPRKATELYAAAAEAGIPERTLDRAKAELHVGSRKATLFKEKRSAWYWFDWDAPWPKDAPFPKPTPGEMPDIMDMMD